VSAAPAAESEQCGHAGTPQESSENNCSGRGAHEHRCSGRNINRRNCGLEIDFSDD
jgi:hypothetical protein